MSDAPLERRELLHQLRNRLNVMGFALYALRSDSSKPMETLRSAHQSATALLNQLGEQERAAERGQDAPTDAASRDTVGN
ncbi:hypothetical protein [Xanthomonas floridensis]|uniref:Histidine kinase n=1 Tax=Xanthomonas floridensis TaxID=1843580 RepID=A0A1A9M841_9XANT|nr:hypothetical protein [Xanthomonas floridensis]MEA5122679.1 hypothetical protein [Xanthomonas floridensis]MEA5131281.1 hypothetical protein [Xanthomonas floridensis]OAG66201.1 hypothetical protein A7D17_04550 [Xanthomonas floridensis]